MSIRIHDRNTLLPEGESHCLLPGPAGHLEVRAIDFPKQSASGILGVICHPHPQLGGSMDNKVVTTLVKAFKDSQCPTLCFNFRGVGASTGDFDHGKGERDDLISILEWLHALYPRHFVYLAGFSFGSFIAASSADYPTVRQLILVAPPVERFHFQKNTSFAHPWFVIQGEQDEVVTPNAVWAWLESLASPHTIQHYVYHAHDSLKLLNQNHCGAFNPPQYPMVIRLPDAGHFFHGQLLPLRQVVTNIVSHHKNY